MRGVLADTGPLYALVDRTDKHHGRAHRELDGLVAEGFGLTVSWPNVLEGYSLVLRKLGIRPAHRWLEEMTEGFGLLNPTREIYLAASERLRLYSDQSITLVDAALAVFSAEVGLAVWTYDHHFDVMGTSVWRSNP